MELLPSRQRRHHRKLKVTPRLPSTSIRINSSESLNEDNLAKRSNSECLPPSRGAKFWPAIPILTSVFSTDLMDQTYIKGTTRLRDNMASSFLLSQVSCRGASDPVSKSLAMGTLSLQSRSGPARHIVQGADQPTG